MTTSTHSSRAIAAILAVALASTLHAKEATNSVPGALLDRPLSLEDSLNIALTRNTTIQKALAELESVAGVTVQTRAIALPKLQATASHQFTDRNAIERFPFPGSPPPQEQNWAVGIRVVQTIYQGGRIQSALRSARLTQDQALLQYQAILADVLLNVRVAYDDILQAAQLIIVQEASLKLLQRELEDTTRRFEAGTVPKFNVLRAEVEVANARPRLIRARNAYRIGKNSLATLLGYSIPSAIWEDIPLILTGRLEATPFDIELPAALAKAAEYRTELAALRKAESLRKEAIIAARSGYLPTVGLFAGYGAKNSSFSSHLDTGFAGWNAGAQASWDIFDGRLMKGKLEEASAQLRKAEADIEDTRLRIEFEVRTTYSNFLEAREVLESQKKVQEQAEEALRLANVRSDAGTGTQLDVLSAQTALTEARSTQVQALHDYSVARSRLERAMGLTVLQTVPATK